MKTANRYPWRLFWFLLAGNLIGLVAIIPYMLALSGDTLRRLPLPLPLLLALQIVQNTLLSALAIGVGLLISRKVGCGAPILEAWLYERGKFVGLRLFALSLAAGAATGAVILGIAFLVFHRIMAPFLTQVPVIPVWKQFLASFYGALNEEILMRLFLLSLLLWLIGKVWHTPQGKPSRGAFWTANAVAAILFGLGHIPAAASAMPINAASVSYILSLNCIGALMFGYLFWKHGLESAMIAHFFADIMLHVAPALPT